MEEVPIARARSWSRCPSARETIATAPIIIPMLIEITKNWIVPAKPTAEISTSSPNWLIHQSARKSTRNIKESPKDPVSVMITTWRMVEPVVNLPAALGGCDIRVPDDAAGLIPQFACLRLLLGRKPDRTVQFECGAIKGGIIAAEAALDAR